MHQLKLPSKAPERPPRLGYGQRNSDRSGALKDDSAYAWDQNPILHIAILKCILLFTGKAR